MNIKQLIDLLKTCRQDALVVLSSDSEGNVVSPLFEVMDDAEAVYVEEYELSGEIQPRSECPQGKKAVCLYPSV